MLLQLVLIHREYAFSPLSLSVSYKHCMYVSVHACLCVCTPSINITKYYLYLVLHADKYILEIIMIFFLYNTVSLVLCF